MGTGKTKEDIERLGYRDVILKGDVDPALVQLLEHTKKARYAPSTVLTPPRYDSQAVGAA